MLWGPLVWLVSSFLSFVFSIHSLCPEVGNTWHSIIEFRSKPLTWVTWVETAWAFERQSGDSSFVRKTWCAVVCTERQAQISWWENLVQCPGEVVKFVSRNNDVGFDKKHGVFCPHSDPNLWDSPCPIAQDSRLLVPPEYGLQAWIGYSQTWACPWRAAVLSPFLLCRRNLSF